MNASIFTDKIKPSNVKVMTIFGAFSASSRLLRSKCDLALLYHKKLCNLLRVKLSLLRHIFDMAPGTVECKTLRQNIGGTKSRCYRLICGNWSSSSDTCLS